MDLLPEALEHHRRHRYAEAEALYRRILAERPEEPEALHMLGVLAYQRGNAAAAIPLIQRSLALRPNHAESLSNLGIALKSCGRIEEAVAAHRAAVRLAPKYVGARFNLANALQEGGQAAEAVEEYLQAAAIAPDHAGVFLNLGNALALTGRGQEAIAAYQRHLALEPASPTGHLAFANLLRDLGRLDEAVAFYRRATDLKPSYAEAFSNLGVALRDQGRFDEAIAAYRTAIRLKPDFGEAHYSLAMGLLLRGDFAEGMKEHEWRWHTPRQPPRRYPQPAWDGQRQPGKTLLLYAEQGLGDTILFARFAAEARRRVGRVILECQAPLVPLLSRLSGVDQVAVQGEPPPAFDLHAPLMSLAHLFGATPEGLKDGVPYAQPDPQRVARWRPRLAGGRGLKVGLVWSGNPSHGNDRRRSAPLDALAPLGRVAGVTFYSLQLGPPPAGNSPLPLVHLGDDIADFADTAAIMSMLDLVISVDTSTAHLAGALGRPLWVMLPSIPDWRWMLYRDDSPWYPSARIFRQVEPGDWGELATRIAQALAEKAGGPPAPRPTVAQLVAEGMRRQQAQDLVQAEANYRRALALQPNEPSALHLLGILLRETGNRQQAIGLMLRAVRLQPDHAEAHNNLGIALREEGRVDEGIASFRRALAIRPDFAEAHYNLGNALLTEGDTAGAADAYGAAVAAKPTLRGAWYNMGNALRDQKQLDRAEEAYRRAIALEPQTGDAHSSLGMCLLLAGKFEEGAAEYEWRWQSAGLNRRAFDRPRWTGQPFRGQTLLLYAEQGMGDTLQFVRYVPEVKSRGGRIVVEAQRLLLPLLAKIPGIDTLVAAGDPLPPFDLEAPLLSLPHIMGTTIKTIPSGVPYLVPDSQRQAIWRQRLAAAAVGGGLKVGLVWAGSPAHKNDRHRSLTPSQLAPLLAIPGIAFFALQVGEGRRDLETGSLPQGLIDLGREVADFVDTAAILANLDLLISVDTAPVHLAGAMGRPAWLLLPYLPDWRWLLDRDDSPWYPTLRLFRQPQPGDWSGVIRTVAIELAKRTPATTAAAGGTSDATVDQAVTHATGLIEAGRLEEAQKITSALLEKFPDHAAVQHLAGVVLLKLGRIGDAIAPLQRAVALRPEFARAHNNLGVALKTAGRLDEAVASYERALILAPTMLDILGNLAEVHRLAGRTEEALSCLQRAVELDGGRDARPYLNLARLLGLLGRHQEAEKTLREGLSVQPGSLELRNNLGNLLREDRRFDEAIEQYGRALAIDKTSAAVLYNLGLTYAAADRPEEAEAAFRQSLLRQPENADTLAAFGNLQRRRNRLDEAKDLFRRALALAPGNPDAHYNFGLVLQEAGEAMESLACYDRAIALRPDFARAFNNRGACLRGLGRLAEAEAALREALRLDPAATESMNNLGLTLKDQGRYAEAIEFYERAQKIAPDFADVGWNRAILLLLTGDFRNGWKEYEWRIRTGGSKGSKRTYSQPRWDGTALGGKTIFLHTEQGVGDVIQFMRYAPMVAALGGRVVLEVFPGLARLAKTLKGVDRLVTIGEPVPPFDVHAPLASLPLALGTDLPTVPADIPYLAAEPEAVDAWRRRFGPKGVKVGLVWAGDPRHKNDRNRSLPLEKFAPLGTIKGVRFFSLQKGPAAAQIEKAGKALSLVDLGPDLDDYADTAAAVSALDLVLTVDTSVAHLAGALGRPTWVLVPFSPDWRWLLEREDSPWYPSLRLFRQPRPADWENVIPRLREALIDFRPTAQPRSKKPSRKAQSQR